MLRGLKVSHPLITNMILFANTSSFLQEKDETEPFSFDVKRLKGLENRELRLNLGTEKASERILHYDI